MNREKRVSAEIVAAYLNAVIEKDASAVDRYFGPDIQYVVNGVPGASPSSGLPPLAEETVRAMPWMGLHRGRKELKAFLARMHQNLDIVAFGPREVISEGTRSVASGWFRLRARSTGRTVDIVRVPKIV